MRYRAANGDQLGIEGIDSSRLPEFATAVSRAEVRNRDVEFLTAGSPDFGEVTATALLGVDLQPEQSTSGTTVLSATIDRGGNDLHSFVDRVVVWKGKHGSAYAFFDSGGAEVRDVFDEFEVSDTEGGPTLRPTGRARYAPDRPHHISVVIDGLGILKAMPRLESNTPLNDGATTRAGSALFLDDRDGRFVLASDSAVLELPLIGDEAESQREQLEDITVEWKA